MSRASKILNMAEVVGTLALAGSAASLARTGYQAYAAKKRREDKIRQAGLGQHLDVAKQNVRTARKQALAMVSPKKARAHIARAKETHRDIVNKGLYKHTQMLAKSSPEKQKELVSQ